MCGAAKSPLQPLRSNHPREARPSSNIEDHHAAGLRLSPGRVDGGAKAPIPPAARVRRTRAKSGMRLLSGPLQKKHLCAETRAESRQQTAVACFHFSAPHPFMQHEEHGSTRKIAIVAQHIPGRLHLASAQSQLLLHIAEQLLTAGVEEEGPDLFAGERMPCEQAVN